MDGELYGIAIIPAITGLIQVAKSQGMPTTRAPLVALLLGLAMGFAVEANEGTFMPIRAILRGIGYGLGASGLYGWGKASKQALGRA